MRGEEKALPQFRQGSGPVTSCMHACSGSGRHVIPLGSCLPVVPVRSGGSVGGVGQVNVACKLPELVSR